MAPSAACPTPDALLARLRHLVPGMQERAAELDRRASFPAEDVEELRAAGALLVPLPRHAGGLGAGTESEGAALLLEVLRLLGRGNPAVGRLYEAHVNAVALVAAYGRPEQLQAVRDGHLFGLWVTDAPGEPLRADDGVLRGAKFPCSGAGYATRAVGTVQAGAGDQLVILDPGSAAVEPMPGGGLQGMRGAANGLVRFDGVPLGADALVGVPGDYLREPLFSCGAWRTTAVTLGLVEALIKAAASQLVSRGHHRALPQQERYGLAWIAVEAARLWTRQAAEVGELGERPAPDRVAYVNLARIAVEAACLDALRLVQRSLGLAAFATGNPIERMGRDLATYLRQPAPDAVLTEAALHMLEQS